MQFWRDQIRPFRYPQDLGRVAQEFGRQRDIVSCGTAAVHHGLLLGGLTVPKGVLQAMFRIYPNKIKKESLNARLHGPLVRRRRRPPRDYIAGDDLNTRLRDLGFGPEYLEIESGESRHQFLDRLGQEMDRGAFVLACIYGGTHWITLGRWRDGQVRAVDSLWHPLMYSLTPAKLLEHDWEDCVRLVRPGIWQKNYDEWLPARDELLRLVGRVPEVSATIEQRLSIAADILNDKQDAYEQLEFWFENSSMVVEVNDTPLQAVAFSAPNPDEKKGQTVVVRRLSQSDPPDQPGPPELIFRMSALHGWQLS